MRLVRLGHRVRFHVRLYIRLMQASAPVVTASRETLFGGAAQRIEQVLDFRLRGSREGRAALAGRPVATRQYVPAPSRLLTHPLTTHLDQPGYLRNRRPPGQGGCGHLDCGGRPSPSS
jgi:hypothetical protein